MTPRVAGDNLGTSWSTAARVPGHWVSGCTGPAGCPTSP